MLKEGKNRKEDLGRAAVIVLDKGKSRNAAYVKE
jgi:hypothetical protein